MSSAERVDAAPLSRHAERVGDKPGKYWDYNECRWATCSSASGEIPGQPERDEQPTPVAASNEADVRSE